MFKRVCSFSISYYSYTSITRNFSNFKTKEFLTKEYRVTDVLNRIIPNCKINSVGDWKIVRQEIFNSVRTATPQNVDSQVLNFCANNRKYDLARSYLNFLKSEDVKLNVATIGIYFRLHYFKYYDKLLEETDEDNIVQLYKELRKKYDLLDSITSERAVLAMSVTKNWKECLTLLDEMKISGVPNAMSYSATAAAAFNNKQKELAWQLLNEAVENSRVLLDVAYITYLQQINVKEYKSAVTDLNTLFEFFGYYDLKCSKEIADKICEVAKNINGKSKLTFVSNKGICGQCKRSLQRVNLTEEEFKCLKTAFFDKVIIGKNVFHKTTPTELQRFKNFCGTMQKYDVVIDGLNVAYSAGPRQTPFVMSMLLASVVRHFVQLKRNVLVLGRSHMQKWPKQNWSYITANAATFLTDNISQDDPYLLYCALSSGMNTIFISRDLMRSHLYLLKDVQERKLFTRWLSQSQYHLLHVNAEGKPFFKVPLPYMVTAQKYINCWHIPYEEASLVNSSGIKNTKWICLEL